MNATEQQSLNLIFPRGDKAPADYFTGTAWVKLLLPNDPTLNCQIGNVVFEPGARNNWHTHSGGQILIVTEGVGYYQVREKPIQVIREGDTIVDCNSFVILHLQLHPDSAPTPSFR